MTTLREGFTTGTAAAGAAFAAACLLLGGALPETALVTLPPFADDGTPLDGVSRLAVPVSGGGGEDGTAFACVIKDGGDDPDATHGARVVAYVSRRPFIVSRPLRMRARGFAHPVYLYGGRGVGRVTLPGLPVAVGEPAINPEPRKQIAFAAVAAAVAHGYDGPLHVLLCVPDGEARARHTLNARLGVLGGISLLGTRGTVLPYSHEAWKSAISKSLDVAQALGLRTLLFSTGRRSERLGFALYPDLPAQAGVQVADYAAFSLREAGLRPFSRIFWVCFPGKLLKLAQGLEWTHAKTAPADIALLARYWREVGGRESLLPALRAMPTAAGAFALMEREDAVLRDAVLRRLARAASSSLLSWLPCGALSPEVRLHVFSPEERLLLIIPSISGKR